VFPGIRERRSSLCRRKKKKKEGKSLSFLLRRRGKIPTYDLQKRKSLFLIRTQQKEKREKGKKREGEVIISQVDRETGKADGSTGKKEGRISCSIFVCA